MSLVRLLAALDRLASTAGDAHDEEHSREPLLDVLLSALAAPALPLAGFRACAEALRSTMNSPPAVRMGTLAGRARDAVGEAARHPRAARDSRVRQALDILLEKPRWFGAEDLAETLALSRSRLAHLLHDDLDVDYRTLRRLVVMKAAAIHVLTTTEQFGQIAYHLGMHAETFDEVFKVTFGCCPRDLRGFWKRLRP
jgi:AraC-like DNA-binding protein